MTNDINGGLLKNIALLDHGPRKDIKPESPGRFDFSRLEDTSEGPPEPSISRTTYEDGVQMIGSKSTVSDNVEWTLAIDGLIDRPISITWSQLMHLPKESITTFYEAHEDPTRPLFQDHWRKRSVIWAGVPLKVLIDLARPKPEATYIWSDGIEDESLAAAQLTADRSYRTHLQLSKALTGGALVAYEMNGEWLGQEQGGPVRLIVPGWHGTTSSKWLRRISLQDHRSPSPFTMVCLNEAEDSNKGRRRDRPRSNGWEVQDSNSTF